MAGSGNVSPLPEDTVDVVRNWCAAPRPARRQVFVEYEVTDRHLAIVERRLPYTVDHRAVGGAGAVPEPEWTRFPVARLRYTPGPRQVVDAWRDRNLRCHRRDRTLATSAVINPLTAIETDRSGIFFG